MNTQKVDGSVLVVRIVGGMAMSYNDFTQGLKDRLSEYLDSSFDRLVSASEEELTSIVGPVAARSIVVFFKDKDNQNMVRRLKMSGVRLGREATDKDVNLFLDKVIRELD